MASGYATLDCVNPVVAQILFASIDGSGAPTGMVTVFSSQAATVFQFSVLTRGASTLSTDTTAELLTNHQPGGGLILRYRSEAGSARAAGRWGRCVGTVTALFDLWIIVKEDDI